jgi:hypothetical protein
MDTWERAAVRVFVPFAFLGSVLAATLISSRAGHPPSVAFGDHLVFAGELLLLGFYGALLIFVPLVRAIAGGELPIELTSRGARFSEKALDDSLGTSDEIARRLEVIEAGLPSQKIRRELDALRFAKALADFEGELAALCARVDEIDRKVG